MLNTVEGQAQEISNNSSADAALVFDCAPYLKASLRCHWHRAKSNTKRKRYGNLPQLCLCSVCTVHSSDLQNTKQYVTHAHPAFSPTGAQQYTRLTNCMSRALHGNGAKQARAIQAANADLTANRNEFYFRIPGWLEARLLPLLQDQRDLPILYLFFNVSVTVLPAGLSLFACPAWAKVLGPLYLACSYALFLERYLLALHYSQHRRLFKRGRYVTA